MKSRYSLITTVVIGMLFPLFFSTFAFGGGVAPFNDESVIKKLKKNIESLQQEYLKTKGESQDSNDYALFIKDINTEAFSKCGYNFSDTIYTMANQGFNKDDLLFKDILFSLIIQVTYSGKGGAESLFEIFPETDAKNLLKIMLTQDAKQEDRNLPDYNLYKPDDIDALLREKWKNMITALKNGKMDEALGYFVSEKIPSYKEVFGSSLGRFISIINTIKNMEMVDFDLSRVKYIYDYEAVINENKSMMSSYIIFVRDENGLWKINLL